MYVTDDKRVDMISKRRDNTVPNLLAVSMTRKERKLV